MTRFLIVLVIALAGMPREAYAFCNPGEVSVCFVNGQQGTRTCQPNGFYGPCSAGTPVPDFPVTGTARPKYVVLTVIYAPPGKTGGLSASSVSYGSGSSVGSTISSSQGFSSTYSVTAKAEFLVHSASLSWSSDRNAVDSHSKDVRKMTSTTFAVSGPAADGIDHDRDQIWLWLGPRLNVTFSSPTTVSWTFDNTTPMNVQFVYVGHLKNPALMPPGVKAQLDAYNITTSDYQEILKADPFANGATTIDPNRYVSLNTTFPYEPPFAPGDPSTTMSFTSMHSTATTASRTVSQRYSVGVSVTGGVSFTSKLSASLTVASTWSWTHTNSHTVTNGATESASVTVGGPSHGYTGPTSIAVYYDLIYKTFMFAPFEPPFRAALEGVVISDSGASVAGKEVEVVADGVTYRTFTNAAGEFSIFGPKAPTMQLRIGNAATSAISAISVTRSSAPVAIGVP